MSACKGLNCGCTDGVSHSVECRAEYAETIAASTAPSMRARVTLPFTKERMVLAVDPGTTESGWVRFCNEHVIDSGVCENGEMRDMIDDGGYDDLAIEMIASYGMAVGREVFETCVWIGRFVEASKDPDAVKLIYRRDVKLHLCGTSKAKDPNVRQAVIDMFPRLGGGKVPQIGTKGQPGPLYGVTSHAWPALAVAITAIGKAA